METWHHDVLGVETMACIVLLVPACFYICYLPVKAKWLRAYLKLWIIPCEYGVDVKQVELVYKKDCYIYTF